MTTVRFCRAMFAAVLCLPAASPLGVRAADPLRVATFRSDITPPLGEPMFSCDELRTVEQPLLAKGVILEAGAERYVLCALDWCELCNGSHLAMRQRIAEAAGTKPDHVAVQCLHQHTAPLIDLDAQMLLAEIGRQRLHVDPKAVADIETRLAAAVKEAVGKLEPFDHVGTGQAKVDRVASSRRCKDEAGKVRPRMSSCRDAAIKALPEGLIDPWLKTITFAQGDRPLVRLHYYATHPQSFYGDGRASSDFPGDAREELERKEKVFQVYFTGCGGDITVGKYNEGTKEHRRELALRLLAGMEAAAAGTRFVPAESPRWRTHPLRLPARSDPDFSEQASLARMKDEKTVSVLRVYAGAVRMAFLKRIDRPLDLSSLQIGDVFIVHLPGEPFVEYQLFAQRSKPGAFVAVAGYGDAGPGYLCTEASFPEGGYEPGESMVEPRSEALLKKAITALLAAE